MAPRRGLPDRTHSSQLCEMRLCAALLVLVSTSWLNAAVAPALMPGQIDLATAVRLAAALLSDDSGGSTDEGASLAVTGGAPEDLTGNSTTCLKQLAATCPLKLVAHPSMEKREEEVAECNSCTASHPLILLSAGCLGPVEKAYCQLPDVGEGKTSEACQVALTAAFQPMIKAPEGARASEAIASWGQHVGDPGFYYQCQGTPGFSYWKVYFSPKNGGGGEGGGGHYHGGGRRLQHHGGGDYEMKTLGLCFPTACSAKDAGKLGDKIIPFLAPVTDLLGPLQAKYAEHTVPNPLDGPATAVAVALVLFVLLWLIATARSTSIYSECAAAMPLDENVLERFQRLLAAASASTNPEVRKRADKLSIGEKWELVTQWEAIGCKTPATLPRSLTSTATMGGDLEGSSLATPLLPIGTRGSLNSGGSADPKPGCVSKLWAELGPIVHCWCGKESFHLLTSKDTREVPEMRCLNGIRALSMMWIVLGHTFQSFQGAMGFQATGSNAIFAALNVKPRLSAQIVPGAQLGVDTFFFLSGFLAAYIGLKKIPANAKGCVGWTKVFVGYMWERWIRLTPAYLFALMFYIHLLPFLAAGPDASSSMEFVGEHGENHNHSLTATMHDGVRRLGEHGGGGGGGGGGGDDGGYDDLCTTYLWTNIFYVSNLFPFSGDNGQFGQYAEGNLGCMDWSWYLSVDYQLHLTMPWLLLLYKRSPKAAYGGMFALWLAGQAYVYSLVYRWDGGICGYFFSTAQGNEMTLYYDKPWCRCGPFFIGIALAFMFTSWQTPCGHLPLVGAFKLFGGYVAFFVMCFLAVFSTYWAYPDDAIQQVCAWSKTYDALYSVFRTSVWGVCVAWLVYTILSCQGGPLARLLSSNVWTPIARLTYGWYLVHPMWIQQNFGSLQRPLDYTDYTIGTYYTMNAAGSLGFSVCLFFLVEKPGMKLKAHVQKRLTSLLCPGGGRGSPSAGRR